MNSLQGLRVIIAGGATGIGATTGKLLAERGAHIVIGDVNATAANALVQGITSRGGKATAVKFDFSQEESIKGLIDDGSKFLGGVDGLLNAGADLRPENLGRDLPVDKMDPAVWRRTMDVNLIGYALSTKYILPHLLKEGKGSIVNISSSSAAMINPPYAAYAASKAGVEILTRHTASTWGTNNIRANSVAFGAIATPPMLEAVKIPAIKEGVEKVALRRMGTPEEAASAILYLFSQESSYVTGQTWHVSGGPI